MTGKEKIFAALSPEGTRDLPVTIPYEGVYSRDRWDELTSAPWWYRLSPKQDHFLSYFEDVHKKLDQDWMSLLRTPRLGDDENVTFTEDGAGRVWKTDRRTGSVQEFVRPPLGGGDMTEETHSARALPETPEQFEEFWPNTFIGDFVSMVLNPGAAQAAAALFPSRCPITVVNSPLLSCFRLWGFEQTMTMFYDNPELLRYAIRSFLEAQMRTLTNCKDSGIQLLWLQDGYCDMISPDQYRTFGLPAIQELVSTARSMGFYCVYCFMGDFNDRLNLLLEAGVHALALEEAKKGFTADVLEIAEAIKGRCAMVSNLDTVTLLEHGSEADLRAELKRHRQAAKIMNGRFLYGLGSPITPGTSLKQLQTYFSIAREYSTL